MTPRYYSILIRLGDPDTGLSWTVTHTGDPHAADELTPIAGLRFGWTMPDGNLWPLQPNPMTAAAAINAPEFAAVSWVGEDVPVVIEVKLHPDASKPQFAFYGRVADAQATPRRGRSGVTLSFTAVDYTIDLNASAYEVWDDLTLGEEDVLDVLWEDRPDLMGARPEWHIPSFLAGVELHGISTRPLGETIREVVAQGVGRLDVPAELGSGTDLALTILAPNIDPATKIPDAAQPWTFDLIYRDSRTTRSLDASLVERGVTFYRNKRRPPLRVIVTGPFTSADVHNGPLWPPPSGYDRVERISVVSLDTGRLYDIGDLYFRNGLSPRREWTVPSAVVRLDQLDEEQAESFGPGFMPQWDEDPGDAARALCYCTLVELQNVIDHTNPYADHPDPSTVGHLAGVEFSLSGGRPRMTLAFRELVSGSGAAGFATSGAYAMTPYALTTGV